MTHSPSDLLRELTNRTLLCDGAMGTQLMLRGMQPGVCGETWNLEKPQVLLDIHRAYLDAGCDLITTNTFGASAPNLEKHGLTQQVQVLNKAGAQLARQAAGDRAWVLGDIGPFGDFLEPLGTMTSDQLLDIFKRQAAALYEGGADGIIIETMVDPHELSLAVQAAKSVSTGPVIATYAFNRSETGQFVTIMGCTVQQAMDAAIQAGADVIGANCGTSLSLADYVLLAQAITATAGGKPTILQPNAGAPQLVDGKLVHPATPKEMAAIVTALRQTGLRILGGCCGTSPDHLRAMGQVWHQSVK